MKLKFLCILSLVFVGFSSFSQSVQPKEVYAALAGDSEEMIGQLITDIGETDEKKLVAYKGVLLMKHAGQQKSPAEKLSMFKQGKELLEGEISNDPENTEYRFFRLLIQENAPKILNYNDKLTVDKEQIVTDFSDLSKDLKSAILAYSKNSTVLSAEDFE